MNSPRRMSLSLHDEATRLFHHPLFSHGSEVAGNCQREGAVLTSGEAPPAQRPADHSGQPQKLQKKHQPGQNPLELVLTARNTENSGKHSPKTVLLVLSDAQPPSPSSTTPQASSMRYHRQDGSSGDITRKPNVFRPAKLRVLFDITPRTQVPRWNASLVSRTRFLR